MSKNNQKSNNLNNKRDTILVIFLFITTLILAIVLYLRYKQKSTAEELESKNSEEVTEISSGTPSPSTPGNKIQTPIPKAKLPSGKITFSASSDANSPGPKIGGGEIDPIDPKEGKEQSFKIEVADPEKIEKVEVIVKTDTKEQTFQLSPTKDSSSNNIWSGKWSIADTYENRYVFTINAYGPKGKSKIDITFR